MSRLLVLCLGLILPGPLVYCVVSWLEDLWAKQCPADTKGNVQNDVECWDECLGNVLLILRNKIQQIGSLEFKCFNSVKLKNMVFILKSRIYASLQLPLVLDNHSKGIDIPIWVRVISATSDKLREVSRGSRSPAPFKSSPPAIFSCQETVASSCLSFYANTDSGGISFSPCEEG